MFACGCLSEQVSFCLFLSFFTYKWKENFFLLQSSIKQQTIKKKKNHMRNSTRQPRKVKLHFYSLLLYKNGVYERNKETSKERKKREGDRKKLEGCVCEYNRNQVSERLQKINPSHLGFTIKMKSRNTLKISIANSSQDQMCNRKNKWERERKKERERWYF